MVQSDLKLYMYLYIYINNTCVFLFEYKEGRYNYFHQNLYSCLTFKYYQIKIYT